MVVKILNVDKCITKLLSLSKVDIVPEIIEGTRMVQSTAKQLVPVDTGTLRGSIMTIIDRDKVQGIVYTVTEYAPYVEFGTSKMRAKPFLIPAFLLHEASIRDKIKRSVQRQAQRLGI